LWQLPIVYVGGVYFNFAWWTLALEVLFYAIAPLIILARPRGGVGRVVAFAALALVFVVAELPLRSGSGLGRLATNFLAYAPCFALGVLLASRDFDRRVLRATSVIGATLVLISLAGCGNSVLTGYGLLYAGITGQVQKGEPRFAVFSSFPMVWLGERSYSLFLTHFSVFGLVCHLTSLWIPSKGGLYFVTTRLVELPLAMLIAMALFQLVETRFARGLVTAGDLLPRLTWDGPATTYSRFVESATSEPKA
jgi:peptidoglycan/LPS O-acetylase OafA/YrhL